MDVDAQGAVYIAGSTCGSLFRPKSIYSDAFLAKYDSYGNQVWGRQFIAENKACALSVSADASGNTHVAWYTSGEVWVDDSWEYRTTPFLSKFDGEGNEVWRRQINIDEKVIGYSVAVNAMGEAYVGGTIFDTWEAFLAKFDADGNQLWAKRIGAYNIEECNVVTLDTTGAVYITGYIWPFNEGPAIDESRVYLMKLDADGNELRIGILDASDYGIPLSMATDASGSASIVWSVWAYGDKVNTEFFSRFDSAGSELWRKQIGTSDTLSSFADSIALDPAGNAFVAGSTQDSFGAPNAGDYDVFLRKFDTAGNALWTRQFGTSNQDIGRCVTVEASGAVHIAGNTCGSLAGPFAGNVCDIIDGPNPNFTDVFLIKLDADGVPGDIDGNGDADVDDFLILKSHFGSASATRSEGDLDGDGDVDLEDFVILKNNLSAGQ